MIGATEKIGKDNLNVDKLLFMPKIVGLTRAEKDGPYACEVTRL